MKKLIILSLFAFLILSQIVRAEIITGKYYKPGETMEIELNYSEPLINVEFSIIRPDGILETPTPLPMKNISSNLWGYNYTLQPSSMNGTYIINISAPQGGILVNASFPAFHFTKTFDVIPWKVKYFLNKYSFRPEETIDLTVLITERYSDNLKFNVFYVMKDSLGSEVDKYNITLTEVNKGFFNSYVIPENYTSGISTMKIILIDSDNRNSTIDLNFSVSGGFSPPVSETGNETNQDYSYIIWYFAIGIVVVIIIITILRYRKIKKRKRQTEEKKEEKQEEKKKEVYVKPQEESYRTEYY